MGLVLFILGFVIGYLICLTIQNAKELKRFKSNKVKPLSEMNDKEFKKAMEDLEIK